MTIEIIKKAIETLENEFLEPIFGEFKKADKNASPEESDEAWKIYRQKLSKLREEARTLLNDLAKAGTFGKMSEKDFENLGGKVKTKWDSRTTVYCVEGGMSANSARVQKFWYAGDVLVKENDTGWGQEKLSESRDLPYDRR